MLGAILVRELHVRDAQRWRKGKEESAAFDGPAEDGRFEGIPSFYAHSP